MKKYEDSYLNEKVSKLSEDFYRLLASSEYEDIFPEIARIIAKTMEVPASYIMIYNNDTDCLELETSYGVKLRRFKNNFLKVGAGIEGYVAKELVPLIVDDTSKDPRVAELFSQDCQKESLMSVPLIQEEEFLGVVSVIAENRVFNDEDLQLFSVVVSKSAFGIRKVLVMRNREEVARENVIMRKLSDLTNECKESQELILRIEKYLPELLGVSECIIELNEAYAKVKPRLCRMQNFEQCHGRPYCVPQFISDNTLLCRKNKTRQRYSAICIPLHLNEETIGVMYLNNPRKELKTQRKKDFLQSLGLCIAAALSRFIAIEKYERRLEALSMLYELAHIMSSSSNLQDTLEMIMKLVSDLLKSERVQIMLLSEDKKELYVRASWSKDGMPFGVPRIKVGEGVAGWVIKHGRHYCIKDTSNDPIFIPSPEGQKEIKSFLCVPLMVSNRRIGVVNVGTLAKEREFTRDDINMLTDISSRAALSIENARLAERVRDHIAQLENTNEELEKGKKQLQKMSQEQLHLNRNLKESLLQVQTANRQLATMYEITKTLASTLELENILDSVLQKMTKILSSPLGALSISLLDEERKTFYIKASRGLKRQERGIQEISFDKIPGKVLKTIIQWQKPVYLEGEEANEVLRSVGWDPKIRAIYIWPLVVKGNTVGVLTVTCGRTAGLREDEKTLLSAVSNQMSVAIENSRLYLEAKRRATELSYIHMIISTIISDHPLQERLNDVVRLAANLMGQEFCAVILVEAERHLPIRAQYGLNDEFLRNYDSSALMEIVEEVIKKGKIYVSSDDMKKRISKHTFLRSMNISSLIIAPLKFQDKVRGALLLGNYGPYEYISNEKNLLVFLSDQVALGFENVMLYRNALIEKEKMDTIVNSMGDGVITLDWNKIITSCNEAACRITGWTKEELVGKSCAEAFQGKDCEGEEQCYTHCPLLKILESKEGMEKGVKNEGRIITKSGKEIWTEATHSLLAGAGDPVGAVIVFRDITEAKMQQQMKSDFIAGVAHDLRTPLAAIKGYAMTLIKHGGKFDENTQKEFFMIINSEIDRLTRLLGNLLNLTRMEVGKLTSRPEAFNMSILVKKVKDLYQMNTSKHIISIEGGQNLSYAYADIDLVEQILNNLISNAIKYSPTGGTIKANITEEDGFIQVCIEDQGIGIPQDQIESVFERYHRVESGITRKISGTGLGLFITKILVEAQKGKIWVESTPGVGSRFYFTIPVAKE